MGNYKLEDVRTGYAEVSFPRVDKAGIVQIKEIVDWTDFDHDEIHKVKRWFAYLHTGYKMRGKISRLYERVGRKTGYLKRQEAIDALEDYVNDICAKGSSE